MDTGNNIVNSDDSEKKQINITGQTNRYQIKKLQSTIKNKPIIPNKIGKDSELQESK